MNDKISEKCTLFIIFVVYDMNYSPLKYESHYELNRNSYKNDNKQIGCHNIDALITLTYKIICFNVFETALKVNKFYA